MSLHPPENPAGPNSRWLGRFPALRLRAAAAVWVLCLAPGIPGCRAAASPPEQSAKRMIENVMHDYAKAYRDNNPDALAALYSDEGMLLPPGHELVKGRDSVRAFWSRGMEAGFQMATVSIEVSGQGGYVVGRYYVPADDQDDAETGKYIISLRRDPDGVWRIMADIWNADDDADEPDAPADSAGRAVALLGQALETIAQSP